MITQTLNALKHQIIGAVFGSVFTLVMVFIFTGAKFEYRITAGNQPVEIAQAVDESVKLAAMMPVPAHKPVR